MTNPFKNGEGKISLAVKIAGVLIPLGAALVGYGVLRANVATNTTRIDKVEEKLEDHETRIRRQEIEQARHDEIDKQVVEALKEVKQELKRRR